MVVPAVDLLYVFGRSLVMSDQVTLIVQFAGNHRGVSCIVCSTEEVSSAILV